MPKGYVSQLNASSFKIRSYLFMTHLLVAMWFFCCCWERILIFKIGKMFLCEIVSLPLSIFFVSFLSCGQPRFSSSRSSFVIFSSPCLVILNLVSPWGSRPQPPHTLPVLGAFRYVSTRMTLNPYFIKPPYNWWQWGKVMSSGAPLPPPLPPPLVLALNLQTTAL